MYFIRITRRELLPSLMDIDNVLLLVTAIVERAQLDVGDIPPHLLRGNSKLGGGGVSKVCDVINESHPARYCARQFLNRVDIMREEKADIYEIALEILVVGNRSRAIDYQLRES